MRTWTATTTAEAAPAEVLGVLTDPDAAAGWAPVPFDVEDDRRLSAGRTSRVCGRLAGRRVGFDVQVDSADDSGLALAADGPVGFDVDYGLAPTSPAPRSARRCPSDPTAASPAACSPRRPARCSARARSNRRSAAVAAAA